MKHVYAVLFAVVLLVLAGCATTTDPLQPENVVPEQESELPGQDDGESMDDHEMVVEESEAETSPQETHGEPDVVISLVGRNFVYADEEGNSNPDVFVSQGDVVRVEYTTESGFHDFVIDAFGRTAVVQASDGTQVLEFVADQAGTFEYYCSVGSHRAQGMSGSFIVE